MPEALHDRACDNWRASFAIADLAGGDWAQHARASALALSTETGEDEQSRGTMLLTDIRFIFAAGCPDPISSTALAIALQGLDARPWSTWMRGKPITSAAIARLLKTFGIIPTTIKTADGKQPHGYKQSQFKEVFERYLPKAPGFAAGTSPSSPLLEKSEISGRVQSSPGEDVGDVLSSVESPERAGVGEVGELWGLKPGLRGEDEDDGDELFVADLLDKLMERVRRGDAALADRADADAD